MNIVFTLSYDGTRFKGWQKTNLDPKQFPTIEYELEEVLTRILQHPVRLQAASRTDCGVHAAGQVVNFTSFKQNLDTGRLAQSVNFLLPPDIRVLASRVAPDSFHATLSNIGKEYHYKLATGRIMDPFLRHTHWHFIKPLDIDAMRHAAQVLVGTHDFKAFRNDHKGITCGESTVRELTAIEIEEGPNATLCLTLQGTNFLYKMARNIAGTLVYVGCGKLTVDAVLRLLTGGTRMDAGVTAPAHGLILHQVFYPTCTAA